MTGAGSADRQRDDEAADEQADEGRAAGDGRATDRAARSTDDSTPDEPTATRRRVLLAAAPALAGCSGPGPATPTRTPPPTDTPPETTAPGGFVTPSPSPTPSPTPTRSPSPTPPRLDFREANVMGVEVSRAEGREFEFAVTLFHDDDGEDGFADWWQVETLPGERLGRLEFVSGHGTQEFTTTKTVSVPQGVRCVVVRGHDQMHGYGGWAAVVTLASGKTRTVPQGSERRSMADQSCP